MAAIDKTYIKSWNQYSELREFFTSCGEVNDETWWYHENEDYWCSDDEMHMTHGWTSSCAHLKSKTYSPKPIFRKLKKWNLPEGAIAKVTVILITHNNKRYFIDFELKLKKK